MCDRQRFIHRCELPEVFNQLRGRQLAIHQEPVLLRENRDGRTVDRQRRVAGLAAKVDIDEVEPRIEPGPVNGKRQRHLSILLQQPGRGGKAIERGIFPTDLPRLLKRRIDVGRHTDVSKRGRPRPPLVGIGRDAAVEGVGAARERCPRLIPRHSSDRHVGNFDRRIERVRMGCADDHQRGKRPQQRCRQRKHESAGKHPQSRPHPGVR